MKINNELMKGSTSILILSLLENEDMYGYQITQVLSWLRIMADKWLSASNWFGKTTETVSGYNIDKGMQGITTDYD